MFIVLSFRREASPLDSLTLSLMLFAGLLHASWHGLVKGGADQMVNLAGMGIVAGVCAAAAVPFVTPPPLVVWPVLAVSIGLHNGYKVFMARAYGRGDLVQAFPLARGAVPLFATVIAFVTLGQIPNIQQLGGIALVSVGILFLTLEFLRGGVNVHLLTATAGAGLTVAGYSVLDAYGTRLHGDWAGFTAWLVLLDSAVFLAFSRLVRGPAIWTSLHAMRHRVLASGLLGIASFTVFLWALSRNPVGPVSAIRETSVLFAMLIGAVVYRELISPQRAIGGVLVVAGIATIAIWK
jgi:drug/metabolite transporter (DMT)-like permease